MAAQSTDYFTKISDPGSATNLAAPGHVIGGTSITVDSTTGWPTDTGVIFAIDTVSTVNGVDVRDTGSYTIWEGVVSSATTITSMVLRYGTDQDYDASASTRVYVLPTSTRENRFVSGYLLEHDQDGTHGAITPTSVVSSGAITGTVGTFNSVVISGASTSQGWTALGATPNTITANSTVPKVFDLVFNTTDLTGTLSNGMKLQLARTVAAPSQCTDLEASSSQYYSKSSPAGMTFTDDFVVSAWIKLESYGSAIIASRYNGTSGWSFELTSSGQVALYGFNASSANHSEVFSYASVPLNKWVHVTAQLDMSTFTATTTTSYVMIDGVDVAAFVSRTGTNPTALVQAGNLEIGGRNGGLLPFDGKIAQVAIYSAKVTQATIRDSINRTLSGSETSLISAYSFNNSINDLNANANNLTANNSAVATNADSPFANAVAAGSLEYAEVLNVAFSTNTTVTVRVPDGCQIPTSGGVSSVLYSTQSNPYGLPAFSNVIGYAQICSNFTTTTAGSFAAISGLTVPVYIPLGGRIRIRQWQNRIASSQSGTQGVFAAIQESSTVLAFNSQTQSASGASNPGLLPSVELLPTSGAHTYTANTKQEAAGTITVEAGVTSPAYLSVEYV